MDGRGGDRLSQIAIFLILLPLAALVGGAVWSRFSDLVTPIEEKLISIEGVSRRYTRVISVTIAVLAIGAISYLYVFAQAYQKEERKRAACARNFAWYSPPCTGENEAICKIVHESLVAKLCNK